MARFWQYRLLKKAGISEVMENPIGFGSTKMATKMWKCVVFVTSAWIWLERNSRTIKEKKQYPFYLRETLKAYFHLRHHWNAGLIIPSLWLFLVEKIWCIDLCFLSLVFALKNSYGPKNFLLCSYEKKF